jgi:hypothetical protein
VKLSEQLIEIVEHEARGAIDTLRHVTPLGHIEATLTAAAERITKLELSSAQEVTNEGLLTAAAERITKFESENVALTKRLAELIEDHSWVKRWNSAATEHLSELHRNALPTNCTRCNGS